MRFVPLIGAQGWMAEPSAPGRPRSTEPSARQHRRARASGSPSRSSRSRVRTSSACSSASATPAWCCSARRRTARPSSTAMRARITRELVRTRRASRSSRSRPTGPTPRRIDRYVRDRRRGAAPIGAAFARFPTWMWRNHETQRPRRVAARATTQRPRAGRGASGFYGPRPLQPVRVDCARSSVPRRRRPARRRGSRASATRCLTPWQSDPAAYGRAALNGRYRVVRARGRRDARATC